MPRRQGKSNSVPNEFTTNLLWRRAITAVLTIGLLLLGPGAPRFALAQAVAEAQASLATVLDVTRALRDSLDPTSLDVEELSLELAFAEPEEIVALVREKVAYEQYPGLLRGAQGTLISGAGNALDQALLLATLLSAAGFDVRIAAGELSNEQANTLISSMAPTASTRTSDGMPTAGSEDLAASLGIDASSLNAVSEAFEAELEGMRSDAADMATRLEAGLTEAGVLAATSAREDVVSELVNEARQYHWVEYGLGGDDWTPVHVLFDEGEHVEVEATDHLASSIPEELQHRFSFQVFIEQRLGDELVVKPVTAKWERPTANMFGLGFDFFNLPDGFGDADPDTELAEVLAATEFFTPVLNGAIADGAQTFDLEGNSLDPADAGNAAAGVFKNVGGAFGRAAGALAGEDDPNAFVALTAQWIEYTLIAPGGEETVHRRTVFDRLADRDSGEPALDPEVSDADVAAALATTYSFMLDPGHYSQDYIVDRGVQMTLASEPLLSEALSQAQSGNGLEMTVPPEYQDVARGNDLLRLFAAFDSAPGAAKRISYRAEPSLVVIERAWSGERARVDVVNNSRRVFTQVDGELPLVDLSGAIEAGAWETRVEGLPIATDAISQRGAYALLEEAWQSGSTTVIAPDDSELVPALALPELAKAAIVEDLGRGYAVIVPAGGVDDLLSAAWWRVDPVTGESLGRTADGRGGELTEYEQTLAVEKALTMGGHIIGAHTLVLGCVGKGSGIATACCFFEGVLMSAGTLVIGTVIASSFAVSALAMFLIMDIAVGGAMTVAGFMDALPSMCSGFAGSCRLRIVV